jgi:MSHA biogenesis protein MshQ
LSSAEYDDIEANDAALHTYTIASNAKYAQNRLVIQIDENEADVTQIDLTWNGSGVNQHKSRTDGASLYIWNYALASYTLLQTSADTEAEVTLTGMLTSSLPDYLGGVANDTITLLVVSNDKMTGGRSAELSTDYVRVDITSGPDHFLISHDGAGIHCLGEAVSVTAIDPMGNPLTDYVGTITLDTQSGTGTWSNGLGNGGTFSDATPNDGLATYTFDLADNGSASFFLDYQTGTPILDIDVFQTLTPLLRDDDTEGAMTFSPSGFTVTANPLPNPPPNPINDPIPVQTAGAPFAVHLAAYGQTPTDPVCGVIESYSGAKMLKFWSAYLDPASGSIGATVDGSPIATAEGSALPQAVTFAAGQAMVSAKYKDVGRIQISTKDDTVTEPLTGIRGTTNPFVMRPADLMTTLVERLDAKPNPGSSLPTGTIFVAAGDPFRVTVEVRDAEGDLTPNYGMESAAEGILLTASTLVAPVGGRNGSNDDGSIGNGSAFGPILPAGTFLGASFYWDEVGAMRLTASIADGDYLGAGDVMGMESGTVGRFPPHHFDISLNTPEFRTGCDIGGFTYVGQPFDYSAGSEPVITTTARSAQGTTTQNYAGSWFKLSAGSLTALAYASATGTLSPSAPNPPTVADLGAGIGLVSFDNGSGSSFVRTTPIAPLDAEISLSVNVLDGDGIAYTANPARFGQPSAGNGIGFSTSKLVRYGRAVVVNGYGPELLDLAVPLRAEFFDGSAFGFHGFDSCSSVQTVHLNLTKNPGALATAPSIANDPLLSGDAGLSFSPPGAGNAGYVDVEADLSVATGANLPWLQYDWPSDGNADGVPDDNPVGRGTFGVFRSSEQVIFRREVY